MTNIDLYTIRQKLNAGIPLTKIHLRVTDYSRVSTTNKLQQSSLKNQVEHFDKMIKENKEWTYIPGYIDSGITGTSDIKRDNFMKMIDDAKKDKFDLIITKEISRFSRNTLDSIKYTRKLLEYGVAVLFINDNINTALPDSELRLTIMASMAQDEIRRLSERVKFGMQSAINRGTILGNNMLYGYKKDKQTGNLILITDEANLVKRIFTMYGIESLSISKIAKILNEEGKKTAQNKAWTTTTIRRMLKNPKYKGYYCGKKTEITNYMTKKVKYLPEEAWITYEAPTKIPPIVSKKLWDRVNERLKTRNIKFTALKSSKQLYQNRYPLSAKIYCKDHKTLFRRRHQKETTWVCATYLTKGLKACTSPHLKESDLYNILGLIFNKLLLNKQEITKNLVSLYKDSYSKEKELKNYQSEKQKLLSKKTKLLDLALNNILSTQEFQKELTIFNYKLQQLEEKIINLKHASSTINISNLEKHINLYFTSEQVTTKLIELLLSKIVVSKVNGNRQHLHLDIYLNIATNLLPLKRIKNYSTAKTTYQINIYSNNQ